MYNCCKVAVSGYNHFTFSILNSGSPVQVVLYMKKRNTVITALSIAAALVLVIFVPPARSLAIDALSIFRVSDVNAISITIGDIEQLSQSIREFEPVISGKEAPPGALPDRKDAAEPDTLFAPIDSINDFTAFDMKLPRSLSSETPKLMVLEARTQTITLEAGKINDMLSMTGAQLLPDSVNGAVITVQTPAVVVAEYSENILIATQMPVFSGDEQALKAFGQSFLSLPQLTYNLRSQLAEVDLTAGIAYVPVIEGFGRRTTVGNSTGYLYTVSDLEMLISSLSDNLPTADTSASQETYGDASALVWARGGVLYILAGNQQAGKLTQIAGSIK